MVFWKTCSLVDRFDGVEERDRRDRWRRTNVLIARSEFPWLLENKIIISYTVSS